MRHPFDGLNDSGMTRRGALGAMAAGLVGLASKVSAEQVQVEIVQTDAKGEGGVAFQQVTTLALGEEGAVTQAIGEEGKAQAATTEPFGEEAGKVTSCAVPGVEDGKAEATEAKGENGGGPVATTRALGEEGAVTKAKGEVGMNTPVVPVQADSVDLKDDVLKAAWKDLGSKDAAVGVQACAVLYGAKGGVTFIKDNLKAENLVVPKGDEKVIAKLIEELDADQFKARNKADEELEKLGAAALAQMEAAVKSPKSAEQRMRLERLINKAKEGSGQAQAKRALEVLVALRTDAAKEVLTKLSKGGEKEWLTQAAKEALEKLPK